MGSDCLQAATLSNANGRFEDGSHVRDKHASKLLDVTTAFSSTVNGRIECDAHGNLYSCQQR